MKRTYYSKPTNSKVIVYAVILVLVLGLGAFIVQDIDVPTETVTQTIDTNLEK